MLQSTFVHIEYRLVIDFERNLSAIRSRKQTFFTHLILLLEELNFGSAPFFGWQTCMLSHVTSKLNCILKEFQKLKKKQILWKSNKFVIISRISCHERSCAHFNLYFDSFLLLVIKFRFFLQFETSQKRLGEQDSLNRAEVDYDNRFLMHRLKSKDNAQ